jgi:hypothetical protein
MPTFHEPARSSANKTEKPKIYGNVAIGFMATAAVIIILISGAFCSSLGNSGNLNGADDPGYVPKLYAESVVSGQIALNAEGFYCVGFVVPEGALNAVLKGDFVSTGNATNNSVMLTVWSADDFANWLCGCQSGPPEYNKDLMPTAAGNINITLPSGIHYIFIDSAAYMQPQTVSAQIDLTYSK